MNDPSSDDAVINELTDRAIDGPMKNARCYVDLNNNDSEDSNEPTGMTDDNGYYKIDLGSIALSDNMNVYCQGGTDIDTNEQLDDLVLAATVPENFDIKNNVLQNNPLTTLLSAVDTANEKTQLLTQLGLDSVDANTLLTTDYYEKSSDTTIPSANKLQAQTVVKQFLQLSQTMLDMQNMILNKRYSSNYKV